MRLDADLGQMLEELAAAGLRPIVHQKTEQERCWVAYTEGEVRHWYLGEGPDPESACRALYVHTFKHPNVPPANEERTDSQSETDSQSSREPAVIPTPEYMAYRSLPSRLERVMADRAHRWLLPRWPSRVTPVPTGGRA